MSVARIAAAASAPIWCATRKRSYQKSELRGYAHISFEHTAWAIATALFLLFRRFGSGLGSLASDPEIRAVQGRYSFSRKQ